MKIFKGQNVPIKSWCNEPEEGAIEQARNLSKLPFIFKQVCLMPDTHQGYGMPIGGVIATKGVVIPNAVGVDIGCGMCAVKTSIKYENVTADMLKKLLDGSKEYKGGIRSNVPVGFNHHKKAQEEFLMPDIGSPTNRTCDYLEILEKKYPIVHQEYNSALKQLGTLGGGNHFIEIQKGSDGYIWIMIHSGSRNLGYKVAKHYNKLAQELCKKWYSNIPEYKGQDGLAFLPLDSSEGQRYLLEMQYCLEFARASRTLMMKNILQIMINQGWFDNDFQGLQETRNSFINIHHNFAQLENHFGQNVVVHRKGATSAKEGQIGIIPGSQGTASYIVKGKGNIESFKSCSHGAGRKMSRKKAREILDLEEEKKKLDDMGVLHAIRHKSNLDEASSAYKNIDVVMKEQKDLVDIVVKLQPLAVVKG